MPHHSNPDPPSSKHLPEPPLNWLQERVVLLSQIEEAKNQGVTSEQIFTLKELELTHGFGAVIDQARKLTNSVYLTILNKLTTVRNQTEYREGLADKEANNPGGGLEGL
jgi:hypothetical protein